MISVKVNETECSVEFNGNTYTNRGAYVDDGFAMVYVNRLPKATNSTVLSGDKIEVTTWEGMLLGHGHIVSVWRLRNYDRMVSVRFTIDGVTYSGRFNYDGGQLVRGKRVK